MRCREKGDSVLLTYCLPNLTPVVSTVGSGILFARFSTVEFNDIRRKLYMVGTYSTVGKRAKRMPDPTVETTLKCAKVLL